MKVEEILKSKGRSVETIEADATIAEAIGRLNRSPAHSPSATSSARWASTVPSC